MRRVQFFELHEQAWFPASLRDLVTDALQCGMRLVRAYAPAARLLERVLEKSGSAEIVDVCSGGGGPWLALLPALGGPQREVGVRLTDKYPNLAAFRALGERSNGRISFWADPVDAAGVPRELSGVRTMFSSFHHFPPEKAAAILRDAVEADAPVAVFETTRRSAGAILWMFPWALLAFFYTPVIRPLRWSRLFWTYLLPVIPAVLLFDGIVSCLRTYRPHELLEIAATVRDAAAYEWEAGETRGKNDPLPVTYLLGWRKERREERAADRGQRRTDMQAAARQVS